MNLIWATRGVAWGFRFVYTGGVVNPLEVYEEAFGGVDVTAEAFCIRSTTIAVRFSDPEGRRDRAGRVIPHEFVILAPFADLMKEPEQARTTLWQIVAKKYAAVWDLPTGPLPDGGRQAV